MLTACECLWMKKRRGKWERGRVVFILVQMVRARDADVEASGHGQWNGETNGALARNKGKL